MIAELGQLALVLALSLAVVQSLFPLVGAARGDAGWMALARPAGCGQVGVVMIAFVFLELLFSVR